MLKWHGTRHPDPHNGIGFIATIQYAGSGRTEPGPNCATEIPIPSPTATDCGAGSLPEAFGRCGVLWPGGTPVGTVVFQHYEGELGVVLDFERTARTDDIDTASFERLSFAPGDSVETPLADAFPEPEAPARSLPAPASRPAHDEAVARGPGRRDRIGAGPDRLPAARDFLLETAGG